MLVHIALSYANSVTTTPYLQLTLHYLKHGSDDDDEDYH